MKYINKETEIPVMVSLNSNCGKMHTHRTRTELVFILEGSGEIIMNTKTYNVDKGDLRIINGGNIHKIDSKGTLKYLSIIFDMPFFDRYIPGIKYIWFNFVPGEKLEDRNRGDIEQIKTDFFNIIKACSGQSDDNMEYIIKYALNILMRLRRFVLLGFRNDSGQINRVWEIAHYIYDNCHRKLPLDEVAGYAGLSPNYLSHYIKDATSKSYNDLVNYLRCENALKILISSDKSVSRISNECGFSELKYFVKHFNKNFGMTPQEYRSRYGGNHLEYNMYKTTVFDMDSIDEESQEIIFRWAEEYASTVQINEANRIWTEIDVNSMNFEEESYAKAAPEIFAKHAAELFRPTGQKCLGEAVSLLGVDALVVLDYEKLPILEKNAICEIAGQAGCLLKRPAEGMNSRHIFLFDDGNGRGLYSSEGIKLPQMYYHMMLTGMEGKPLFQDSMIRAVKVNGGVNLMLDCFHQCEGHKAEYKSFDITIRIKGLKKREYDKVTYRLKKILRDGIEFMDRHRISLEASMMTPVEQELMKSIYAPEVECEVVKVSANFCEIKCRLHEGEAILVKVIM